MADIDDSDTRYTPAWWMRVLTHQQRRKLRGTGDFTVSPEGMIGTPGMNVLDAWLKNNPPLPPGAPAWLPVYQAFHASTRSAYAPRIITSASERMTPIGFRTGADDDENGDALAERIWAENKLPIQQVDLTYNMMGLREAYTMVGVPKPGSDIPIVTVEDPRQIQVALDPLGYNEARAAIKTYHDPYEELDVCVVYIRGETPSKPCWAYTATKPAARLSIWGQTTPFRFTSKQWTWDDGQKLPISRVPIGIFRNRRDEADFELHLPHLDRINRISLQRMLIGEMQSFRQRAVKGLPDTWPVDHPVEELRGKPIDYQGVFDPGPGSMWKVPPGADFWESQPVDLNPLLNEENMEVKNLAALSGMLVAQFNPDDANGTAEGASLQRETLTFRIEDRKPIVEAGLADTLSMAFEIMGETQRSRVADIETIWAEHEKNALSEMYAAAAAAAQAGLARRTIRREVLKFTPRQLRMAQLDDDQDTIMAPLLPGQSGVQRGAPGSNVLPFPGAPAEQSGDQATQR